MTPELEAAKERDRLRGLLTDARSQLEAERERTRIAQEQAQEQAQLRVRAEAQLSEQQAGGK